MISIVIPTLNSGKYLKQTLDSIFMQDMSGYEVIVIDGFSEDDTQRILREYGLRFNASNDKLRWYFMDRQGQVPAINYGLSMAKGDILTFINSDDTYEPYCFRAVDYYFRVKPDLLWLYGIGKVIDGSGQPTRSLVTKFKSIWWGKTSPRILSWFDYIVQPAVFWKRSLMGQVGEFNPEYPYCFDYEYWLRCFKVSKPSFINYHLANWRAHKDAISVRNVNAQIDESLRINLAYAQSPKDMIIQNLVAWIEKIVYGVMK